MVVDVPLWSRVEVHVRTGRGSEEERLGKRLRGSGNLGSGGLVMYLCLGARTDRDGRGREGDDVVGSEEDLGVFGH